MRDLERLRNIEKNNEAFKALSLVSRRISELEAENDKLRTQLMDAIESMGRVEERCAKLQEQGPQIIGETSDGYHTFNELYHHRAVLFSVIVRDHYVLAWKSKKHHDGTMYDGMFIVGINTPKGQATYHYDIDPYWDMFECRELDAAPEWDGHTPDDAIARIATLGRKE